MSFEGLVNEMSARQKVRRQSGQPFRANGLSTVAGRGERSLSISRGLSLFIHLRLVRLGHHGFGEQVVDDAVGHRFTRRHQLVELTSAVRARHDFGAKEITGREMREAELHLDVLALGAFAHAGAA